MTQTRPQNRRFTYAEYLSWPEDERWEIIGGEAVSMSPAPSIKHQNVAGRLYSRLERNLAGKPCIPLIAPTDVVLSEHDVVQPDILVVCDPTKITERNVLGAPDLVVEVLSPTTALKDLREKKALYQRHGVREYLILDPLEIYALQFFLNEAGNYGSGEVIGARETLRLSIFPDINSPLGGV
jgi:Uma2 family endonuclease